ncbi:dynein axonemal assembly factor 1-like [Daphnia pulex]|uniref:dynein axonemal assembly factor 1-like n=1 Tax=Daphnia pulex TaxID=6669 RepID=UPI001EDE491F|nr:dynein axonemal assembly factor 1-like [Daphnia pulex]
MEKVGNVYTDSQDEQNIFPRITAKWLRNHCRKHGLYQTPHLNEVLYLQHQGFQNIELLEEYTGIKSLWLDHNRLANVSGLNTMTNLKCLFIRNNYLTTLSGIECLSQLVILDVSNNELKEINEIELLKNLTTLYIGNNKLSETSSIEPLPRCKSLSTLDLSKNRLSDYKTILNLLSSISQLSVLYLLGNPVVRSIDSYRLQITVCCKNLTFLDEKPIQANDRFCAKAWLKSGIKGIRQEKARQKDVEDLEMIIYVLRKFTPQDNTGMENTENSANLVDIPQVKILFNE